MTFERPADVPERPRGRLRGAELALVCSMLAFGCAIGNQNYYEQPDNNPVDQNALRVFTSGSSKSIEWMDEKGNRPTQDELTSVRQKCEQQVKSASLDGSSYVSDRQIDDCLKAKGWKATPQGIKK